MGCGSVFIVGLASLRRLRCGGQGTQASVRGAQLVGVVDRASAVDLGGRVAEVADPLKEGLVATHEAAVTS